MTRATLIALLLGGAVLLQPVFFGLQRVMRRNGGVGIVAMERLGSWERADPVLAVWKADGGRGLRAARLSVWVDFLFIPAYALGLYLVALAWADHAQFARFSPGWARVALSSRVLFLFAGVLDVLENVFLLVMLRERRSSRAPEWAAQFASSKFTLLGLGGVLLLTVAIAFLGP